MTHLLSAILKAEDIQPVLVDVGASSATPAIWRRIAGQSFYVGFDPDLREMQETGTGAFRKSVIVNAALTPEAGCDEVEFFLTRFPQCSSTLEPDAQALSAYLFAEAFQVERQAAVKAVTLNAVLDQLSLRGIDWLKVDTQGTDLRLWQSLRSDVRSQVLAVDLEPGLIDAYLGEDLFTDVHTALVRDGFWLSNLQVCGPARMRLATLDAVADKSLSRGVVEQSLKTTPGWVEARYLRSLESLAQNGAGRREWLLLWMFALLDRQPGFALDLALEYEKAFGTDALSQTLRDAPLKHIRRAIRRRRLTGLAASPLRLLRGLKQRLLP